MLGASEAEVGMIDEDDGPVRLISFGREVADWDSLEVLYFAGFPTPLFVEPSNGGTS